MADLSESDYGMFDYGDGYYSIRPIWLFESAVRVPVNTSSDLSVFAFRRFEASVRIPVNTAAVLNYDFTFGGLAQIPFFAQSDEYIGNVWSPDVPVDGPWVPDIPFGGDWNAVGGGDGPWEPVGPDLRPNKSW